MMIQKGGIRREIDDRYWQEYQEKGYEPAARSEASAPPDDPPKAGKKG